MTQPFVNQKGRQLATHRYMEVVQAIGIPNHISLPFKEKVLGMLKHSGVEFTVQYLKDVKTDFIRLKAGMQPCSSWTFTSGSPRGLGKVIHKWVIKTGKWSKLISLLNFYTLFISPNVTNKQINKFVSAVRKENICAFPEDSEMIRKSLETIGIKAYLPYPTGYGFKATSSNRRAPLPFGKNVPDDQGVLSSIDFLYKTKLGRRIRLDPRFMGIVSHTMKYTINTHPINHDLGVSYFPKHTWSKDGDNIVGSIGLIQEPGYKLRAVANPGRIYQHMLTPLGRVLFDTLKSLPWDCTHDQSKGFIAIKDALRNGTKIHSIDLSSATDNFPLSLQMEMMRSFISFSKDNDQISLFEIISRGNWRLFGSTISWTCGQPLGLYPSFAAFALTHGLILFGLNNHSWNNKFYVLGDDVLILDDELAQKYRSFLDKYKCPISESKSLISNTTCEFAGKIIDKDHIIPQFKWRTISDDNFIDIVKNFGPNMIRFLKSKQRKICKLLYEVPDFMGGLGFNPSGRPLSERVFDALILLDKEDNKGYKTCYNRDSFRINYQIPNPDFVLDQAVIDKITYNEIFKILPSMILFREVLGLNIYSIDSELNLRLDSPEVKTTLLDKLSYLLH